MSSIANEKHASAAEVVYQAMLGGVGADPLDIEILASTENVTLRYEW